MRKNRGNYHLIKSPGNKGGWIPRMMLIVAILSLCKAFNDPVLARKGDEFWRNIFPPKATSTPVPSQTPAPLPTVTPTPTPILPTRIPCSGPPFQLPCEHLVKIGDNMSDLSEYYYGTQDYVWNICWENWEKIDKKYQALPLEEKYRYKSPCDYLCPGWKIIIPPPPTSFRHPDSTSTRKLIQATVTYIIYTFGPPPLKVLYFLFVANN